LKYYFKSSSIKIYHPPGGRRHDMNEDRKKALQALRTSKGQIEGIIKMIEDERYCMDISNQIIAAQSLLKKANMMILRQHLNHCVKDAFMNNTGDEKINEIMELLSKLMKD
jgi:DNA-binding FrmR family transcriptional regulator